MPIYAFHCQACDHSFDRLQKMSDPDPDRCPQCGEDAVRRKLTAPAFRLAGSGWYETDFKKDGDKKRNLADAAKTPEAAEKPAQAAKAAAKPEAGSPSPGPAAAD